MKKNQLNAYSFGKARITDDTNKRKKTDQLTEVLDTKNGNFRDAAYFQKDLIRLLMVQIFHLKPVGL